MTKRDSSVEVDPYQASADPYQAYYAQYDPSAVEHPVSTISEKQGFAGAMENVFGDDAAVSNHLLIFKKFQPWKLYNKWWNNFIY